MKDVIEKLRLELETLDLDAKRISDRKQVVRRQIEATIALALGKPAYEIEIGSWECPPVDTGAWHEKQWPPERLRKVAEVNPNGRCVYIPAEDPCRDRCVFCGYPEERK